MNVTKTISAATLALGLSLSGLAGTAAANSNHNADLPRALMDKGGQHGCGAASCGSKSDDDKGKQDDSKAKDGKDGQQKGGDKKCGAGKCGAGSCG
ncbi:MAG: hypothetical protein GXP54_09580 [Deltaproteobacteria bacterium]|nr:hypothetical protein [Deltaproteobacteria bacterium]